MLFIDTYIQRNDKKKVILIKLNNHFDTQLILTNIINLNLFIKIERLKSARS